MKHNQQPETRRERYLQAHARKRRTAGSRRKAARSWCQRFSNPFQFSCVEVRSRVISRPFVRPNLLRRFVFQPKRVPTPIAHQGARHRMSLQPGRQFVFAPIELVRANQVYIMTPDSLKQPDRDCSRMLGTSQADYRTATTTQARSRNVGGSVNQSSHNNSRSVGRPCVSCWISKACWRRLANLRRLNDRPSRLVSQQRLDNQRVQAMAAAD